MVTDFAAFVTLSRFQVKPSASDTTEVKFRFEATHIGSL